MKHKYIIITLACVILSVGALVSYGIYVNVTSNAHVSKLAAAQSVVVNGAAAKYRELAPILYLPTLNLHSTNMMDVHFQMDGTITQIVVKSGDNVRKGQLLGEIANVELSSQILQAQGKVDEAQANYIKYEQTVKRYGALVTIGGVSQQQLDEAIANRNAAMAETESNQAYVNQITLRLENQKIVAPQDGEVLKVYHTNGEVIRTGDSLVMIGDFSTLVAKSNVRDEVLQHLMPVTGAFKLKIRENEIMDKVYDASYRAEGQTDDQNFNITVDTIEPPLGVPATYRSIVWKVYNPAIILEPSTYYEVEIYSPDKRRVLSIPKIAVMETGAISNKDFVFVVTTNHLLERRDIKRGMEDDEYIEIQEGLKENDMVVVSDKIGLIPGMKVQVASDSSKYMDKSKE